MPLDIYGKSWRGQGAFKPDSAIELGDSNIDLVEGPQTAYSGKGMEGLLNLIGKAESGVHGYNQVYGGKAPITDMSINEVLEHQDKMKAGGSPSTAAGRYQILQKTLTGLKKELGLSGDEKMTPELQDGLAIHLMRRRGLDRYVRGELDQSTFVNRLAQEWAGLPTMAGQSYYAGDGLNKSNVPLDAFMSVVTDLATSAYSEDVLGVGGTDNIGGGEGLDRLEGAPLDFFDKGFLAILRSAEGIEGTPLRLFNDVVQRGRTEPITESDLTGEELGMLESVVRKKIAATGEKKGKIDYSDYKGSDLSRNILGGFQYEEDEDGNIQVIDKYDFNTNRGGGSVERNLVVRMLSSVVTSRDYAASLGRMAVPPGKGVDVKIKLPKKQASDE